MWKGGRRAWLGQPVANGRRGCGAVVAAASVARVQGRHEGLGAAPEAKQR